MFGDGGDAAERQGLFVDDPNLEDQLVGREAIDRSEFDPDPDVGVADHPADTPVNGSAALDTTSDAPASPAPSSQAGEDALFPPEADEPASFESARHLDGAPPRGTRQDAHAPAVAPDTDLGAAPDSFGAAGHAGTPMLGLGDAAEAAPDLDAPLDADVGVSEDREPPASPEPDLARIAAAIQRLSEIGGDGRAQVSRLAFTPAEREAHALFAEWLDAAGFAVRVDAFGNTIGERPGTQDLPRLALGSHLDSVPSGGRFDGVVGVVGALEVARMLQESGTLTRHPLRIVAFANEEGARFGEACLGSKAVCGAIGSPDADRLRDADGVTLATAMTRLGLDPSRIEQARWADDEVAAFLELHIEQGRLLEAQELSIGVVDAIAGNTRLRVSVHGRADHSGGTPMELRQDALTGAAEMVLDVERVANEPARRATVATVGRLAVSPNNITTIPGRVDFSVDVRDVDSDRQRDTAREIVARFERIATRRGLHLAYEVVSDTSPSVLPLWLRRLTKQVCLDLELPHRVMASGAGHDAQILARRMPAAMLFVPSHEGLSHVPEEWTGVDDIARGVRALHACLLRLDQFLAEEVG